MAMVMVRTGRGVVDDRFVLYPRERLFLFLFFCGGWRGLWKYFCWVYFSLSFCNGGIRGVRLMGREGMLDITEAGKHYIYTREGEGSGTGWLADCWSTLWRCYSYFVLLAWL
ncbi:hypothetical protein K402DRAFT_183645 [Aulographum hederae CBS 113979]|uniref:Uncharacterized protein n=1 Tax=Aulographum hederae CBS 113979 TaxID=1176131 RepID=A0A6G1GQ42_9PEZI|nr:hypothetical protein K402DRAFT_183645 [Aulographum hederae CBS 113979]